MLAKSLNSPSDTIIYDLEDSVAPNQKIVAREGLVRFLRANTDTHPQQRSVRINALESSYFAEDIARIVSATRCVMTP